jgi:type II secretory pathway pseudopilin PulG
MRANRVAGTDEGFSLIETLVALTLVIVTMATMGTYLVKSFGYVAHQRSEQVAAQLANSALEQVRALKGDSLASGRTAASVTSQINSAPPSVQKFLSGTSPASDDYASGNDAAIPTAALEMKVASTPFTRQIYVGECEIYLKASGVPPCTVAKTARTGASSDYLRFYRAVVLITWPDRFCTSSTCEYITSTLIARAPEPTFNVNRPPMDVNPENLTFYFYQGVTINSPYTIPVSGGQLPITWSLTASEKAKIDGLGLNMNGYGVITGTPNKVSAVSVAGTAHDAALTTLPATLKFSVVPKPVLDPLAETSSYVGEAVSLKATVTGGSGHNTFTMTDAPGTMAIDEDGNITGTVIDPGQYTFTILCTDSSGTAVDYDMSRTYTYTFVSPMQLAIADQRVTLGASAFTAKASATGGDHIYTYTATGLPNGVTINPTDGTISGVLKAWGRFMPTVTVTDDSGGSVNETFVFIVDPTATTSLKFTAPPLDAPDPKAKFTTNDQLLGLNATLSATGAPPGVNFNANANKFIGSPNTSGNYRVTVTASTLLPPATTTYTFMWTVP